jgi:hypothetical protein
MDGDLRHAPEDIPAPLGKIDEGYDIASVWRKERVDNAVTRKIPSRIANWLMSKASGLHLPSMVRCWWPGGCCRWGD